MKDFKVRCTFSKDGENFILGNVYKVKDGFLEDGDQYPFGIGRFTNIEQINRYVAFIGTYEFEKVEESKMFTKDDVQSGDKVWTENGHGVVIGLGNSLIIFYLDHRGWDYAKGVRLIKVIRTDFGGDLLTGDEDAGTVVFDREKGIGCEPPIKEIALSEATKLLTEKFGENVKIVVNE